MLPAASPVTSTPGASSRAPSSEQRSGAPFSSCPARPATGRRRPARVPARTAPGTRRTTSRRLTCCIACLPSLPCAVALGDADADVEDVVAARKDPAVAGREALVPDDLEAGDARRHRRIADVAAQGDAARRAPIAHARRRSSPAAARRWRARSQRRAITSRRARRAAAGRRRRGRRPVRRSGATKRTGACMRAPAATAARQMISSRRRRGSTARRAGHVDPAAARRDAGERRRRSRLGHHRVEDAEPLEGAVRVGDQAVAADLVARKGLRVDQDDVRPARASSCGAGAPAGPAPTTSTSQRSGSRSKSRFIGSGDAGRCRPRVGRGPAPMRQAATHGAGGDRADQREGLVERDERACRHGRAGAIRARCRPGRCRPRRRAGAGS